MSWILYIYPVCPVKTNYQMYKGKYVYIIREYNNEIRSIQSVWSFLRNQPIYKSYGDYKIRSGEFWVKEQNCKLEYIINYFKRKAKRNLYLRLAKRRMDILRYELIEVAWHPDRLKWII
jgi:hypothetical protein